MLMEHPEDDGSGRAAAFIAGALERFGFGGRWAYQALHQDGRCYGLSERRLNGLYQNAALIINLHGGTEPRTEHVATDRLVYLETDPVEVEVQLAAGRQDTIDFLKPHCAYFTFAQNYGRPDCLLPLSAQFRLQPTRQPVVLDFWQARTDRPNELYTTIGNWRQQWREVQIGEETYSWSKDHEFLKFLGLPSAAGPRFELALAGCGESDRQLLEGGGWRVREALPLSQNIDIYRHYISGSHGEFTVAKEQNVRLRTGWFSDRSATYLAAGRPVITQDTGFGNDLPIGEGLFAFSCLEDILEAVELIDADYERQSAAAAMIAHDYFDSDRVLTRLLHQVGLPRVPPGLVIAPRSRRPLTLPAETVETVLSTPPAVSLNVATEPATSVVVVTRDGLMFTKLCLESVLGNLDGPALELIVVDNGSTDGTVDYLDHLAKRDQRVRFVAKDWNMGFAAAANLGLGQARGQCFVLLNNDTIVPPSCLARLTKYLEPGDIGGVGPVTNRIGNEAQVDAPYQTYQGLLDFAGSRERDYHDRTFSIRTLAMFCLAMRRITWE